MAKLHILILAAGIGWTMLALGAAPQAVDPATTQAASAAPTTAPATLPAKALENLARRWRGRITSDPRDIEGHFDWRLLRMMAEMPAVAEPRGLAAEDQEMIDILIDGLGKFRSAVRTKRDSTLDEKIRPLLTMADGLRDRANLSLPNVALCTQVQQFGIYDPVPEGRLPAGDARFVLYCEVANFHPMQNAAGLWETRLTYELGLYPQTGGACVYSKQRVAVSDSCRNRRRDFFIADQVTLPQKVAAGKYLLKVSVTDEQAKRIAEASTGIEIVGK